MVPGSVTRRNHGAGRTITLRPGEKLFEELLADSDTTLPTSCAGLALARLGDSRQSVEVMRWLLDGAGSVAGTDEAVRRALRELLGAAFSEPP